MYWLLMNLGEVAGQGGWVQLIQNAVASLGARKEMVCTVKVCKGLGIV